jgi:tetratricopeptide (TPR) repeat protein
VSATQIAATDYRHSGDDHFYNLEFDQAIADYTKLIAQDPADPISYNNLASAELYKEAYRLGLLDSIAFVQDTRLLRDRRLQADTGAKELVLNTLERGRRSSQTVLARDPSNVLALYSLCTNYALLATYEYMLEKSWFEALRNGSRAQAYCDQVRRVDPEFTDAYLVLGVYQYTAASLPLPVKLFAAIGGLHGSKKKGIEYVSRVAEEGRYDRDAARVVLAMLYCREKRPLEAAHLLEALIADYPRNYLYGLELASVYSDAGQPERSLSILKSLLERADQDRAAFGKLPREAVQRKVQILEVRLSTRTDSGT